MCHPTDSMSRFVQHPPGGTVQVVSGCTTIVMGVYGTPRQFWPVSYTQCIRKNVLLNKKKLSCHIFRKMPSCDLTCGICFFKGAPQESRGSMHPCVRTGLEHLTHQLEVQGHGITMFEEHVTAPVILHENEWTIILSLGIQSSFFSDCIG